MGTTVKKVIIIGGGIIGCAVAWRLAGEGDQVTILERGRLGQEASWAAAGMIAPQAEAQGPGAFFDLCIRARDVFDQTVGALIAESGVDPEYDRNGILYLAFNDAERAELEERARWQVGAGGAVEELSSAAARKLEPAISGEVVYALRMPLDRRVDNRKLTRAYAAAAILKGVNVLEGVQVAEVIIDHNCANGVRTHDGHVHEADLVIDAAGAWAGELRGLESDRVATYPVRGQILCFESRPGSLSESVFSPRGYLVPRRDGRVLAGSTMEEAGYNKAVTLAGIEKIARGAATMVPGMDDLPFREAWAGLRPATRDFMPVLGPSPSAANVLYAAGHFRSGILLSALTGEITADIVHGRKPAIDLTPFTPARFTARRQVRALGLVRDILFRSRIDAVAQALGAEVAYASTLEQARARSAEIRPAVIFADLSDAEFAAARVRAEFGAGGDHPRLIGFASHVDLKGLSAAREAGFDLTLSRSEFTARIAEFLKG